MAASTLTRPARTSSSSRARRSLSIGPALEAQQKVGAAGLEAGEVDGHVEVAELAKAGHDRLVAAVLPQARDLLDGDLEPRQPLVVTHAELAEAERADELLGRVDLAQLVRRDPIAVLEARREAGERGLVPRRQPELAGEVTDLALREPGVDQRRPHTVLDGRFHAGAMIAEVVDVGAVDQRADPLVLGDRPELVEQLVLAEEAPVGAVACIIGIGQLLRAHHDVAQSDQVGELPGLSELTSR